MTKPSFACLDLALPPVAALAEWKARCRQLVMHEPVTCTQQDGFAWQTACAQPDRDSGPMIQLAWLWLRHQPDSLLSHCFQERVAGKGRLIRKIMLPALAVHSRFSSASK